MQFLSPPPLWIDRVTGGLKFVERQIPDDVRRGRVPSLRQLLQGFDVLLRQSDTESWVSYSHSYRLLEEYCKRCQTLCQPEEKGDCLFY